MVGILMLVTIPDLSATRDGNYPFPRTFRTMEKPTAHKLFLVSANRAGLGCGLCPAPQPIWVFFPEWLMAARAHRNAGIALNFKCLDGAPVAVCLCFRSAWVNQAEGCATFRFVSKSRPSLDCLL